MVSAKSIKAGGPGSQSDQGEVPFVDAYEVMERLRAATGKDTDSGLASFLKVPYSTLASWRRRNAVPMEAVITVANFSGSTIDWLLLGKSNNGEVQSKSSVRPLFPNFSQMAVDYGIQFACLIHSPKIENVSALRTAMLAACISAQATIDQLIEQQGGDETNLRNQMDTWIARIAMNMQNETVY